jgi:hypothetical protein
MVNCEKPCGQGMGRVGSQADASHASTLTAMTQRSQLWRVQGLQAAREEGQDNTSGGNAVLEDLQRVREPWGGVGLKSGGDGGQDVEKGMQRDLETCPRPAVKATLLTALLSEESAS